MMRSLSLCLVSSALALVVTVCRPPAPPADVAADRAAVDAALEEYRQAWLQGDTAMALRRLSGDVRFLFPGTPDLDSAAVHALVIDEMAKYTIPSLTLSRADFFIAGDHEVGARERERRNRVLRHLIDHQRVDGGAVQVRRAGEEKPNVAREPAQRH